MNNRVIIEPPVELDLAEITNWYKKAQPKLVSAFISSLDRAINFICEYLEASQLLERGLRRAVLSRFPYNIFYFYQPELIRVVAVLHASRNPTIWQSFH